MALHLAISGPMDVGRLARDLDLQPLETREIPLGHGGHSVTELAIALAPLVDRLDLISFDQQIAEPVSLAGSNVRCRVGPWRTRARARSRDLFRAERGFVARQIQLLDPEVVSAHWTYEYALGALESGYPTLVTVRDWAPTILRHEHDWYRAVRLTMQAMTFLRGRHFAAVSPYMARKVEVFARQGCAVLPNGLGDGWFSAESSSLANKRVLSINNSFNRRKNVRRLLESWPSVLVKVPTAELSLVGDGYGIGGPAHLWAKERGLTTNVVFRGVVSRGELPSLLRSSRVLAHPALEESFGMVVLEAMALGVPVLGGTHSGAVPWLLADGAGVLVDVRNPLDIAAGLVRLLAEDAFAEGVVRKGIEQARMFGIGPVAEAYIEQLEVLATT